MNIGLLFGDLWQRIPLCLLQIKGQQKLKIPLLAGFGFF